MKRILAASILSVSLAAPALAGEFPEDPLKSVMWEYMAERFFSDGKIVFDPRVRVHTPDSAENQMLVPVTVDARGLWGVREILVVADLNPLPHVLTFHPDQAEPFIGFRLKVEQATAIRVGVKTVDGTWYMGGKVIDAAGGGCTAPASVHSTKNWMASLGKTRALVRRINDDTLRVKVRMKHPMDTGLADGIPVFHMNRIGVESGGDSVARIALYEPVSEDPTVTIMPKVAKQASVLDFSASDTEGNTYSYHLPVPAEPAL
ncbi:MAG: quinoprotein dehydrogenase-associated SoxYZ-like carrier [Pseudomonadota bacterium]